MHFISNHDLYQEIVTCQETNVVSDRLARMLQLMVEKYALRPNWRFYSYLDEMKCEALLQLVKCNNDPLSADRRPNVLKFNAQYAIVAGRKQNPFAYVTTIISNAFRRYVKLENGFARFRDDVLIESGVLPSAARQFEDEMNWSSEPILPRPKPKPRPARSAAECHSATPVA